MKVLQVLYAAVSRILCCVLRGYWLKIKSLNNPKRVLFSRVQLVRLLLFSCIQCCVLRGYWRLRHSGTLGAPCLAALSSSPTKTKNFTSARSAFFWVVTQRVVVMSYRRCGTTYRSHPETMVRNYHYSLRNNPEETSSQILRGGSLKSRNISVSNSNVWRKPGHITMTRRQSNTQWSGGIAAHPAPHDFFWTKFCMHVSSPTGQTHLIFHCLITLILLGEEHTVQLNWNLAHQYAYQIASIINPRQFWCALHYCDGSINAVQLQKWHNMATV